MVGGNEDSTIQVSYGYGLFTGGLGAHAGGEAMGCTVIPTSSGNTKRQVQMLQGLRAPTSWPALPPTPCSSPIRPSRWATTRPPSSQISGGIFGAEPCSENMRRGDRRQAGHPVLRRLRPLRDHGPGRGHGMRRAQRSAHRRGPLLLRDHRPRDAARASPTAKWASSSSPR